VGRCRIRIHTHAALVCAISGRDGAERPKREGVRRRDRELLEGRKEVRAKRERHSTGEQAGEEKREGVCLGREKDKEKKEKKSKRGERGERAEGRCVCV
jgi:hypothetical protein